jgi:methylphosphotriester-DNA--protein-cysteine methyltransferase
VEKSTRRTAPLAAAILCLSVVLLASSKVGARALKEGSDPVLHVAQQVGYESEAAFNRAFQREFGMPPATWRRQSR